MELTTQTKALADALRAEDVSSVFQQPSYGGGQFRPNDPNYAAERTASALQALVTGAGQNIEQGMNSPLNNTGAPPAPHADQHGDRTAMSLIHATMARG